MGGVLLKADWPLLTSKWNKKREGEAKKKRKKRTALTQSYLLTPLSGNVVQASSVVAHRLSIRVSVRTKKKQERSGRMADLVQRKPNCCTALRSSSSCLLDKRTQVKAALEPAPTCTLHLIIFLFFRKRPRWQHFL